MSHPQAELLTWAGGEHPFFLRIGELKALQKRCGDVGPLVIYSRLISTLEWKVDDILETIRLGLIGGSNGEMTNAEAGELIKQHIIDQRASMIEHAPVAAKIIHYTLIEPGNGGDEGSDEEKPGTPSMMPGMTAPPT